MSNPLHLRIFLSSPSDVSIERRAARAVVDAVQKQPLLRGKIVLETVSYDDPDAPSPMNAGETPQASVNRFSGRPADCDLTVVILWSRLGTPMPPQLRRADGSCYASGTVWEFEDAVEAGKDVWLYRRTEVPSIALNDPAFERKQGDFKAVDAFFRRFENADGSLSGGCNAYAGAADFSSLFASHLASWLRQRLDTAGGGDGGIGNGSDLTISPLAGRRVQALSGHPILVHPQSSAPVYTGGVQVSFTLAHNGIGRQPVNVIGLELELLQFEPGESAALAYTIEGEAIQGAGVVRPHLFSISVDGGRVLPATWIVDGREGRIAVARSANFFDTQDPRQLSLAADGRDVEALQGTVLAQATGLYRLRFRFDYSVGGVDRQQTSEVLMVYGDE